MISSEESFSSCLQNQQHGSSRLFFIDASRSIALFLTVYAHLYSVNSNERLYIYAFHMPLFFLISGYLHNDTKPIVLFRKLSKKLLVPFVFFLAIGYLYFVISSRSLRFDVIFDSLKGIILGKSIIANDILWFLLALFWVRFIGNLIILYPVVSLPAVAVFIVLFIFRINWLYLGSAFMALPFYLIGHYGKIIIDSISAIHMKVLIACFLFFTSFLITSYNGRVSIMATTYGNSGNRIVDILLFYLNGLIGSISVICLALCLPSPCYIISRIAEGSMSILGFQFIPIMIWIRTIGHNQPFLLSILFTILIMTGCLLFDSIIKKKAKFLVGGE